ncbi:MAG TPA: glycosyltransferase family 1 protein [Candidatus Polarisedimenticolaceae bacterium]|nr:glycosyltransferase family 1 protein [Candidatus Polarisedimenticolaceae bacterium]
MARAGDPMRIGVMLRCIDERGGIGVYARNIVEELLKLDHENHYILFFRSEKHLHRFHAPNVTCRLLPSSSRAWWDQVAVPRAARRDRVDLLFNPKFTLPLLGKSKAVMVVHGADWFLDGYKQLYSLLDRLYMRVMMPLYFRRASAVISASEFSTRGFVAHLRGSASKLRTIHYCGNRIFHPVADRASIQAVLDKHGLHDPFILTAIHYDSGRKNFANMAKAFALVHRQGIPHKFVVCGRDVERYAHALPLREMGIGQDVLFLGWVEQEDLPALYNAADLYLYPTRLEGFPIPITEALACGTPIVTSKGGVFPEAAGEAAVYVDPEDPADIAAGIRRVLEDPALRQSMREKGLERAKLFTWERCASLTLALLQSLASL